MTSVFGDTLRRSRGGRKTQVELATHLDLSTSYVSDVEHGRRSPFSDEMITKIAGFLEVDEEDLLLAAARTRGFVSFSLEQINVDATIVFLVKLKREFRKSKGSRAKSIIRELLA